MGGLELVKWLAFAAMLADHVDLILLDRSVPVLHAVGRFALPAFAVAFGLGLARSADKIAAASRLVLPALVAGVAWEFAHPLPYVNVLVTFFFAAVTIALAELHPIAWVVGLGLTWIAGPGLEGGAFAAYLVVGAWATVHYRTWAPVLASSAPWLLFAASPGVAAGLVAPFAAAHLDCRVLRRPGLLLWAYPAHVAALGAVRALT